MTGDKVWLQQNAPATSTDTKSTVNLGQIRMREKSSVEGTRDLALMNRIGKCFRGAAPGC